MTQGGSLLLPGDAGFTEPEGDAPRAAEVPGGLPLHGPPEPGVRAPGLESARLGRIARAGIRRLEADASAGEALDPRRLVGLGTRRIRATLRDDDLALSAATLRGEFAVRETRRRREAVHAATAAVEALHELGGGSLLLRPLADEAAGEEAWRDLLDSLYDLEDMAARGGVRLGVEPGRGPREALRGTEACRSLLAEAPAGTELALDLRFAAQAGVEAVLPFGPRLGLLRAPVEAEPGGGLQPGCATTEEALLARLGPGEGGGAYILDGAPLWEADEQTLTAFVRRSQQRLVQRFMK